MDNLSDLGPWSLVIIISLIGLLTKLVYFKIGNGGREAILEHIPKLEPERLADIENRYENGGSSILLLSSVPAVGSAIAAAAGMLETPVITFVVLVLISNLVRNTLVVFVFGQGIKLLTGGE
jgi:membrane protein YqaA with SNARE-associated domain